MKAASHQKSLFMYLFVQFISISTVYADKPEELTIAQQTEVLKILDSVLRGSSGGAPNSRTLTSKSSKSGMKSRFDDIKQTESFMLPEKSSLSQTKRKNNKHNALTKQVPQTVYNNNSKNYHIYGVHQTDPQIQELLKEINNLKQFISHNSPDTETRKKLQETTWKADELERALDLKNQQEEVIRKVQEELDRKNKELEKALASSTAASQEEAVKLKSNIQTLENKASSYEEFLKQKDSELQKKVQEVELKAAELKKIQTENQQLFSNLTSLQADLQKSKQEADVKAKEAEKVLQEKIAALESEKNKDLKTQTEISELKNQLETIQKEKSERDQEVTQLKTEIENSNKKAQEFEVKIQTLEAEKNEVEKNKAFSENEKEIQLKKLNAEKIELENKIESISSENEKKILNLTEEMAKEKKELEQVKAKNVSLKTQLEDAKKNQNEVTEKAQKAANALQEKIKKLEEEKKNIQAQQSRDEGEKDKRISELTEKIDHLTQEKNNLDNELQTEQKKFNEASKKIDAINKEIEILKQAEGDQTSKINQLEETAKAQTELLQETQKQLDEKAQEARLLAVQAVQLDEEKQNLKKDIESLKNDKETYTKTSKELSEKLQKEIEKLKRITDLSPQDQLRIKELTAENEGFKNRSHEIELSHKKLEEISDNTMKELNEKNDQIMQLEAQQKELEENFKKAQLGQNSKDELTNKIELLNQEKTKLESEKGQALENLNRQKIEFENSLKEKELKITALNKNLELEQKKIQALEALNKEKLDEAVDKLKGPNLSLKNCEEIKSDIRKLGKFIDWTDEDLNTHLNPIPCHQTLELQSKTVEVTHLPQKKNLQIVHNTSVNIPAEKKKIINSNKELSSDNSGTIAPRIPEGEHNSDSPALTDLKKKITNYLDQPENGNSSSDNIKNIFDPTIKTLPLDEQKIVIKFIKAQILRRQNNAFKNSEKYRKPQNTSPVLPSEAITSFKEMEEANNQPGLENTNQIKVPPQKEIEEPKSETIPEEASDLPLENFSPDQKNFQEIEKLDDAPAFTKEDLKSGSRIFWVIGPDDLDLGQLPKISQKKVTFNQEEKEILERDRKNFSKAIDDLMNREKYLQGPSFNTIKKEISTQKIFHRFTTDSIRKIQSFLDEVKNNVNKKIKTIHNTTTSTNQEGGTKNILLNNWKDFLNKIGILKETVQKSHQQLVKTFAENKDPLRFKQWTDTKVTKPKKHSLPSKHVGQNMLNK